MELLITGMILFYGMHLVPALTLKDQLIKKIGLQPYLGLFSLVSALGLGLMIYGKGHADIIHLFTPIEGAHWVPVILMWPALISLTCTYLPCSMKTTLRHPMLLGVLLFSVGHVFANGDLATLLLVGSFGVYSLLTIVFSSNEQTVTSKPKKTLGLNILAIVLGSLVYILAFMFHQHITGMPIPI